MQKKNNAPLNNQPKEPTERKTKKRRYPSTKKIVSQKMPSQE
jgi:hypothetical protein